MHYYTAKANVHEQTDLRKKLRNSLTPAEATLWKLLKNKTAGGYKFRRQQGIGPYILDFYSPELQLCVELDGSSHDNKYEYDEQRTQYLNNQGICVMRFRNEMIWNNLMGVVSEIVRKAKEIEAQRKMEAL